MAALAVIEAFEGRLADNWTTTPIVGALTPDDRPQDGSGFLLVQYPVTNSEQASVGAPGANVFRDEGVASILIHRRKHEQAQALADAEVIGDLFRGKEFGGVVTRAPYASALADDNDRGLFFVLSVAVPYVFDRLG